MVSSRGYTSEHICTTLDINLRTFQRYKKTLGELGFTIKRNRYGYFIVSVESEVQLIQTRNRTVEEYIDF
jgi:DNA-binding transcriptional regulator YhcF (GntR family)